jgi:hypothetical protein
MPEEATTTETVETAETATTTTDDQRVPYERFQQANNKAKEAAERAKALERDLADLRAQIEERETAGLPELERERKRAEQLEKRAAEAEKRAEETERNLARSQRERWVTAAASAQNFADPSDASAFVNLDDIEDEKDAERAVKRLAASKKHLVKDEDPKLPGRVLADGRRTAATTTTAGGIDPAAEADQLAQSLKQFLKTSRT